MCCGSGKVGAFAEGRERCCRGRWHGRLPDKSVPPYPPSGPEYNSTREGGIVVHVRNVGGAVLGWVVMAGAVFLLFAGLWMVLGVDGAFEPGSWDVSGGVVAWLDRRRPAGRGVRWVGLHLGGRRRPRTPDAHGARGRAGCCLGVGRRSRDRRRPAAGGELDGGDELRTAAGVADVAESRARGCRGFRWFTPGEEPIANPSPARAEPSTEKILPAPSADRQPP